MIKKLSEITIKDIDLVGGKAAILGELLKEGIPVPWGFVITTDAFEKPLGEEVLLAFDELDCDRVAVRSSALVEDSSDASWAGQLESYLNVKREDLLDRIKDCWESIKSERALSYGEDLDLSEEDLKVAVIIQKMVDAQVSGVMFTKNPVTGDPGEIMIEAGFGLGEMIVQGTITPDNFIVSKSDFEVLAKEIEDQETMLIYNEGNVEVPAPAEEETLTDEELAELAALGLKIEQHFGFACDIEWAEEDGKFYIVQSRPITT